MEDIEKVERIDCEDCTMWKCPRCARSFNREGQEHYSGKIETVDQYIEEQDEYAGPYLNEVRQILHIALPEAQKKISWILERQEYHPFCCLKKHLSLYMGINNSSAVTHT